MWNIQVDAIDGDKFKLMTLKDAGRRFSYDLFLSRGDQVVVGGAVFTVKRIVHNIDTGIATATLADPNGDSPVELSEDVFEALRMNGFEDVTEASVIKEREQ